MAEVIPHLTNQVQDIMDYAKFRQQWLPTWSKDDEELRCMHCGMTFNFVCRRHHCRFCGMIFCQKCSSNTINMRRFVKNVRVCDGCYRHYNPADQQFSDDVSKCVLWIPKEWVPYCMCCADMFNWIRGKEHCRKCGQVVCRQCSKTKQPLENLGFIRPVPVCKKCAADGNPIESSLTVSGEALPLTVTWLGVGETF